MVTVVAGEWGQAESHGEESAMDSLERSRRTTARKRRADAQEPSEPEAVSSPAGSQLQPSAGGRHGGSGAGSAPGSVVTTKAGRKSNRPQMFEPLHTDSNGLHRLKTTPKSPAPDTATGAFPYNP